jgi:phosphogluconate dehydratase
MLAADSAPNIGIVSSYNDMLSAHQPYRALSGDDQAGGRRNGGVGAVRRRHVPAMCDGVTQGHPAWSCRCSAAT